MATRLLSRMVILWRPLVVQAPGTRVEHQRCFAALLTGAAEVAVPWHERSAYVAAASPSGGVVFAGV